ncbi:CarboxypepD_reg-like domain-containing protein [Reichenbachiella agariperforans]|uniref:CarboxypepD_reg-like domain-containing protein n=1 Tax=Reichenbachiella agariperforans TaxID=156994 RepID=A0A1M6KBI0_REIAG|nr:DUF5686 and carboxypeptidase-like regulatory domain-containing protein [Reichenbachiella agariperforans]SHJ56280.1 CarboxypepD_reg-like domain-containing protein [Reichenbachiella agariperforans]
MRLTYITVFIIGMILSLAASAQNVTRIRGVVTDAETGEVLPFVNISFEGTTIGTTSNSDGIFYIESDQATTSLKASYIGYDPQLRPVTLGASQKIDFQLTEGSLELEAVTISSKKLRYRNKENPAVTIIQKVIDNKEKNRMESLDYYEYNKYEKVEFDFNNIPEDFKEKRIMRDFQVVFDYVDTSDINGKTYLPIFLRETSSQVYYRKNPEREVEYRLGTKLTGFEDYFDNQGISYILDKLYQDVDIYDNNMSILSQRFVSPISSLAPLTYQFYIADTLVENDEKLFKLSFQPRNKNSLAFIGNVFITTDSAYAVKKIDMRIADDINLNFVEDMFIKQEFKKNEYDAYVLKTDEVSMDFSVIDGNGLGIFGRRTVSYNDLIYNQQRVDTIYTGNELVKEVNLVGDQSDEFWDGARHMELSKSEKGVYALNEEVEELPAFKRLMNIMTLLVIGYQDFNKWSIGPVGAFVSWNQIEGTRFRFGGMTTEKFSRRWQIEGYGAYGLKDEAWKYAGVVSHYFTESRLDHIRVYYANDLMNPGENLQYSLDANAFSSFRRGVNDKMIYTERMGMSFGRRLKYGFSYSIGGSIENLRPGGVLSFEPGVIDTTIKDEDERKAQEIEVTELTAGLRFGPNEKFYQGRTGMVSIPNEYPVVQFKYWHGFKGVFDADYSYDRFQVNVSKRFYVSPFGFTDVNVGYTQLWGKVPYPLLTLPRGNQSYSYLTYAFNMMNYLEFVSDQQFNFQVTHFFNGYILNKVPLIKKLKLRSIIGYKMLWGSLSDVNNPDLHDDLAPYPRHADGEQATYALTRDPYMEASIGVSNIFKFMRLDVVKRISYLERPNAPQGWALRMKVRIEF